LPQLDPVNPATLSISILQDVLYGELGFEGVIVTDALDMKGASGELGIPAAAVKALAAGADLLCIGTENTDEELAGIEAAIEAALADGTLHSRRVENAVERNRALALDLEADAGAIPVLEGSEPRFPLEPAIAAFDVQPGVVVRPDRVVVSVETTANIAVGGSPWGLAAAGLDVTPLRQGDPLPALPADGTQLVIVGKDNHRHDWVRELIELARERNKSTLVVDMGWPSDGRDYADVATFGASRYVGRALAAWLVTRTRETEEKQ
jgi:beta-N-acetylhexosaminidase